MISTLIRHLPGYSSLRGTLDRHFESLRANPFLRYVPPGHFYSPIPDQALIDRHRVQLFDQQVAAVPGVDLNADGQRALLTSLAPLAAEFPFPAAPHPDYRYHHDNAFFRYADALLLFMVLRRVRPKRVIEVGSGFSSAVMLDTNDRFLDRGAAITFIEPYPDRLLSLLRGDDRDRYRLIPSTVQDVPLDTFAPLEAGDVLFIDSSHVAKIGSDVVHLFTHVLPRLAPGVLVHVHDIFWPFEYPEEWILQGRAWNENYLLKAFLQFNSAFTILLFNSYLRVHHSDVLASRSPLWLDDHGGSIWLERTT